MDIKDLIQGSRAIGEKEKKLYEVLVQFLDKEALAKLTEILIIERQEIIKIEEERDRKKSKINSDFLTNLQDFFDKTEKEAIAAEENDDRNKGDKILESLNNL